MFDVLDQLIGPLSSHINDLLSQPITGTDDQLVHSETKRAYLTLLNSIMSAGLHGIFISDRTSAVHTTFDSLSILTRFHYRQQWIVRNLTGQYATAIRRRRRSRESAYRVPVSWTLRHRLGAASCCGQWQCSDAVARPSRVRTFRVRTVDPRCFWRAVIATVQHQGWTDARRQCLFTPHMAVG